MMRAPSFWMNANRTFFVTTQWFLQYLDGYQKGMPGTGPYNVLAILNVSTGYFPPGQHNLRFPFYGSELQNDLLSLPFTTDGEVVHLSDLPEDVDARSLVDADAWLQRLDENQVDLVAVFGPEPPQAAAIDANPDRFELVAEGTCPDGGRLYRVLPA